ncbi:MAG: hypothetical protein GX823_00450 [Clostridiales bacterium]|nr:hypothetical protein [Clostridiales bacterium]
MAESKNIAIPLMHKVWELPEREYPITQRENLMRALRHEKPMWIPNMYGSSQIYASKLERDNPPWGVDFTTDWFGVQYKYSEAQSSSTPLGNVMGDITEWETALHWEDLSKYDWKSEAESFVRDETKALYMMMANGPFERLHGLEGFEQALVDLVTEPEAVRAYMERVVDFRLELFNEIRDCIEIDYVIGSDDWGTMRAPFFSVKTFEETILQPTIRFVKGIKARGVKFISHCCGVIEPFIPYLVEEIGVDGLEIQPLNDFSAIFEKYGDRVTIECAPNAKLMYNPDTTEEQVRAHARSFADKYGAHAVRGPGAIMNVTGGFEKSFYAFENELYEYSCRLYSAI